MRIKLVTLSTSCLLFILIFSSCNPVSTPPPPASATATLAKTAVKATATIPPPTPEPNPYPLSEAGPYAVGMRTITTIDPERNDRAISITLWYPAIPSSAAVSLTPVRDADPDLREAPYPLILSSSKMATRFAPFLISNGFTWASVDNISPYAIINPEMIEQPLDILFTLNYVAENPPHGLEGIIDAENTGVTGYSFDGYNTYAVSGARIDEKYYRSQCPTPDKTTKSIIMGSPVYSCYPLRDWGKFTIHADRFKSAGEDGLWQPITDERIRAVMPMAGEGWWLFGERGLAAIDRPVLILGGSNDELYPENALIFEHIGTNDKSLISFKGLGHMMIYDEEIVKHMAHFMVSFFGFHLQGREDLANYFSEDFVAQHDDLAWGVVSSK